MQYHTVNPIYNITQWTKQYRTESHTVSHSKPHIQYQTVNNTVSHSEPNKAVSHSESVLSLRISFYLQDTKHHWICLGFGFILLGFNALTHFPEPINVLVTPTPPTTPTPTPSPPTPPPPPLWVQIGPCPAWGWVDDVWVYGGYIFCPNKRG